jgi:hypothetical protein
MIYDIHSPLPSLRSSIPSMDLYPSYDPLISTTLFHLYGLLSPLLRYGPFSLLRPSVPSTALCSLYGPLSPLEPSVHSTGPLPTGQPSASWMALLYRQESILAVCRLPQTQK